MTDINTFNATALLIFRYTIDYRYEIDTLDIPLISSDNLQKSEDEQSFGHLFITYPVGKSFFW